MTREEIEAAVTAASGWLDGDTGYDPVLTMVARALLSLHADLAKATAECERIRPVYDAACAWRRHDAAECDGTPRPACGCELDLEAAIDSARRPAPAQPERGEES